MIEVTEEMIEKWKEEYSAVYRIRLPDPEFTVYFRPLTRPEYMSTAQQAILGAIKDGELEIVKLCILNEIPENLFENRPGVVTVVHDHVMAKSGFVTVDCEEL